jgi:hypothetical protein
MHIGVHPYKQKKQEFISEYQIKTKTILAGNFDVSSGYSWNEMYGGSPDECRDDLYS